ncbi:MAG TPA: carboxypeptidase regulatory-like domain-containing protein [Longimicrobiales bacterium]|nr:carboxypeptidase regulatory-like domain-containing protein [Longimicrobiales bacterium]
MATAVAALLCASDPHAARGQVVQGGGAPTSRLTGSVLDRQTEAPVPGARVHLVDATSRAEVVVAESDDAGAFDFPPVAAGAYGLRVERIGYQVVTDSVTLDEGDDEILTVYLVPEAIDLEPLVVRVPRTVAYYMRAFENRRATGNGTFITRSQIERRRASLTSEMLHSLGGVRVQYGRGGEAALFVRGTCRPQLFLDGVALHQSVSIDMAVLPDDLEGVEVYSNATIPAQYASAGACAAILLWTRPAVRGEGRKVPVWKMLVAGGVLLTLLILGH